MLAGLGVTHIQGSFMEISVRVADAFVGLLDGFGMRADSVHAPFVGPDNDLSHPDPAVRARLVADRRDWLRFCADMGVDLLLMHSSWEGVLSGEISDRTRRAAESLRELLPTARETGVSIVLENLPTGYFPATPEQQLGLLEAVGDPMVKLAFDSGHAMVATGDAVGFLERVIADVRAVHFHDNDGNQDQHLPPGEGHIDWPAMIRVLDNGQYAGSFMIEWHGMYEEKARRRAPQLRERLVEWGLVAAR